MKMTIVAASAALHVAGLAMAPSRPHGPADAVKEAERAQGSCRCDYEMTVTDGKPPRALTLGTVPQNRFEH
jgi:hypothetical protein